MRGVQLLRAPFIISPITTGTREWAHRVLLRSHPGTAFCAIPRRGRLPIDMRETSRTGSQAFRRIDGTCPLSRRTCGAWNTPGCRRALVAG